MIFQEMYGILFTVPSLAQEKADREETEEKDRRQNGMTDLTDGTDMTEKNTEKPELLSMFPEELEAFVLSLGESRFRARQLLQWMNKGSAFSEMSNLPQKFRETLAESATYFPPQIRRKLVSPTDGTVKFLFSLADGECIESVVMRYEHGLSICISCQAGCRMGCRFCASTLRGKKRDLTPGEMLGQIIAAGRELGERISHVVMMGIGEPLDNYENVTRFLRLVNLPEGLNLSHRNISLSTCGIVPRIYDLAKEGFPITLSISLHAVTDGERSEIMPVNRKYGIHALLTACAAYFERTGRRISFEYTLLSGINDSPEKAEALAALLRGSMKGMPLHVNLIPVNPVAERDFSRSDSKSIKKFQSVLLSKGVNATVRRRLGGDIGASCGQLRYNEDSEAGMSPRKENTE